MQCKLQEEVKALRRQLEAAREQLRRGGEEKTCLEALLEQRTQEGRISLELLEEKNKELLLRQQDAQQVIKHRKCVHVCVGILFQRSYITSHRFLKHTVEIIYESRSL